MQTFQLATRLSYEPATALRTLRERPTFLMPLFLLAVGTMLVLTYYYRVVDFPWLVDVLTSSDPRIAAMPDDQRAKAAGMLSRDGLMWSSALGALVGIPVMRVFEAVYYLLAGRLMKMTMTFKQWLALACWTALPSALALPLMLVAVMLHPNGQIGPDQLQMVSLNEVVFHVSPASRWHSVLSNLTLLQPWCWWLTVLAVREWTGRSWRVCLAFSMLPVFVIYGSWAVIALLQA